MNYKMVHNCFTVADLEKSIEFYKKALGLTEVNRIVADGLIAVFLANGNAVHQLELLYLENHPDKYDLGDNEFHLAFTVNDFEKSLETHRAMGCVKSENPAINMYMIADSDGYILEIWGA